MADLQKAAKEAAEGTSECVKVAVRCRPFNSTEKERKDGSAVNVDLRRNQINIVGRTDPFTFDYVYDENARQMDVYNQTARPLVESVLNGYNGTIFAYGQTGTGKTWTMEGLQKDPELRGLMPNSFHHIFEHVDQDAENMKYLVRASFLEIYCEDVFDLLHKETRQKMDIRQSPEGGFFVKDLSQYGVKSVKDCMKILKKGCRNRTTGATKMNAGSSRSHSILSLTIESCFIDENGEQHFKSGKLNLVDLAGSERQKKTEASGDRLKEGIKINKSLLSLGNCIKALVVGSKPPFRDSKLTKLLKDSLGGNCKTVMIAAIGPSDTSRDETLGTLRYADRAKEIKNFARVNEDPKDALLRKMQQEIQMLKDLLQCKAEGREWVPPAGQEIPAAVQAQIAAFEAPEVIVKEEEEIIEELDGEDPSKVAAMREAHAEQVKAMQDKVKARLEEQQANLSEHDRELHELARKKEKQAAKLAKQQAAMSEAQQKLAALEGQIAVGKAAFQDARAHDAKVQAAQQEVEALDRKVAGARDAHAELEEDINMAQGQLSNKQDEVKARTKALKQLWNKYQKQIETNRDIEEEFEQERQDLTDNIRELTRQLTLKSLILDYFVPPRFVKFVAERSMYDTHADQWRVPLLEYSGNVVRAQAEDAGQPDPQINPAPFRRPMSAYGRVARAMGGGFPSDGFDVGSSFDPSARHEDPAVLDMVEDALDQSQDQVARTESVFYSYEDQVKSSKRSSALSQRPASSRGNSRR